MDRKNSMLMWKAKDIFIFILSIVGLALLLIYGSRAIAGAGDRRYVEGWQNRPALPSQATPLNPGARPAVLAHIMPADTVKEMPTARPSKRPSNQDKGRTPSADEVPGQGNGLTDQKLPVQAKENRSRQ